MRAGPQGSASSSGSARVGDTENGPDTGTLARPGAQDVNPARGLSPTSPKAPGFST